MRKSLMIKCIVLLVVFSAFFTFLGSIYSVNSFALESHAVSSINYSSNSYQGKSADNTDVAE